MMSTSPSLRAQEPVEILPGEDVGGSAPAASGPGGRELAGGDGRADAVRRDVALAVEVAAVNGRLLGHEVRLVGEPHRLRRQPEGEDGLVELRGHSQGDLLGEVEGRVGRGLGEAHDAGEHLRQAHVTGRRPGDVEEDDPHHVEPKGAAGRNDHGLFAPLGERCASGPPWSSQVMAGLFGVVFVESRSAYLLGFFFDLRTPLGSSNEPCGSSFSSIRSRLYAVIMMDMRSASTGVTSGENGAPSLFCFVKSLAIFWSRWCCRAVKRIDIGTDFPFSPRGGRPVRGIRAHPRVACSNFLRASSHSGC
jgi:hypothetical protein